jgi:hypothetical protein
MNTSLSNFIRTPVLIFSCAVGLGWASQANAYFMGESEVTIDWNTVNIVQSGISISTFNQQTVTGYYDYPTQTQSGTRYYDWDAHSLNITDSNSIGISNASDAGLYSYAWARLDSPGEKHFDTVSSRGTQFTVSGAGTLTISVDYILSANTENSGDPGSWGWAAADAWLGITNLDTDLEDFVSYKYVEYNAAGSETASEWDDELGAFVPTTPNMGPIAGTFTATVAFEDGQEGVFSIHTSSEVNLKSPSQAIPVPTTLALMGLGLVGLGFAKRNRT